LPSWLQVRQLLLLCHVYNKIFVLSVFSNNLTFVHIKPWTNKKRTALLRAE